MNSLRRARYYFVFLTVISLLAGHFGFLTNSAQGAEASLYISPTTGRRNVGETFQLAIRVNTGGQAINAAEGSIIFNVQKIEVVSVSKAGSIFNLWTDEPTYSNAEGTVSFSGGLPSPGYSGSSGLVFTITFRGKSATTLTSSTNIALVSGAILANDGYGTNILTSLGKSSFFIAPNGVQEPAEDDESGNETVSNALSRPVLNSRTHPDQSKWYSERVPILSWTVPSGVSEVRLVLSNRASSIPFVVYRPPIAEKKLDSLDDGIWYLNARFLSSGQESPIASYRLQVDATAPKDFAVIRQDVDDSTNPRPELLFATSDDTSGIDHYELDIAGQHLLVDPGAAQSGYELPLQKPGSREIKVVAIDKAGNKSDASYSLTVVPLERPTIESVTPHVEKGESLVVQGHAPRDLKVTVELLKRSFVEAAIAGTESPLVKTTTVSANEDGVWTVSLDDVSPGAYVVRAHSVDDRDAVSEDTDFYPVRVGSAFWSGIGSFFKQVAGIFPSATVLLLLLLTLLFLGLGWLIVRHFRAEGFPLLKLIPSFKVKGKKGSALNKDEGAMFGKLDKLAKDVEEELQLLKRVGSHRQLYPEEKYLREKLNQYKKTLKLFTPKK